jgi:EAL domain-containing protein (putative c-di-GMP-specific phosphodiesterase class I)
MEHTDAHSASLERLRALGERVAVDDFGTGYSSLMYLRRFPVDVLKLDRYFVADLGLDPTADAMVRAFVQLAHSLGLIAVAEGVETARQRDELVALGCDCFQGYLWSTPLPPDAVSRVLQAGPTWPPTPAVRRSAGAV